tara:strand:+ start:654 stop:962 length:309 start_codon:yes stop_codon:yes gene_type:complete
MLFEQMKTIKEKVEFLLINYPELRDDDFRLISNYFAFLMQDKIDNMSAKDFLKLFSQGKLPHTESIRRCRQKLQEENSELRGLNYVQRQDIGYQTRKSIKDL